MNTGPGNLFTGFLEDFYAEGEEHLASARRNLLALEPLAGRQVTGSAIEELLRSFHSLKGLSAMVGVNEVTLMAHVMEEYLRDVQTIRSNVEPAAIEALMDGVHAMEEVIAARRKGLAPPDISSVLNSLKLTAAKGITEIPTDTVSTPAGTAWHFSFVPSAELSDQGINVGVVREKLKEVGVITRASPRVLNSGIAFDFVVSTEKTAAEIGTLIPLGVTLKPAEEPTLASAAAEAPATAPSNFVRVEMQKLDELMRLIGEMVISRAHFDETIRSLENRLAHGDFRTLQEVHARIERQLRNLRQAVMQVRMVPIAHIFERMRFVVRGLERDTNKHVRLEIKGQDTEIDKLIVDRMLDPLLHMVRNAVSHGIEKEGIVTISARTAGERVIVEVQDNGRGIDLERVTAKARSAGVIGSKDSVDVAGVLEVICAPGFSTREGADLTSGRGVGMAVVRSTIQELGGSIELETAAGEGTKFTVTLPLTLVILDALLITLCGQRFAVPQSEVREILAVEALAMRRLEKTNLIPYRGGVLPVIHVSEFLKFNANFAEPQATIPRPRIHVLVIGSEGKAVGLIVDKVTGQREIVVRPISDPQLRIPGIIGATELGDGKPVLIVDAEVVARLAGQQKEAFR